MARCIFLQYSAIILLGVLAGLMGCTVTSHRTVSSSFGTPTSASVLEGSLGSSGPVTLERVVAARWAVSRAGLINLDHPKAAALEDGLEPIEIYFYVVRHPDAGTFWIDSGVAEQFADPDADTFVGGMVASQMNLDRLEVETSTAEWIATHGAPDGVFLSHLHLDHVMGLPDLPAETPLYVGPGETATTSFLNLFVRGSISRAMEAQGALRELDVGDQRVLDVFGDQSFFALHVPGHTAGSLAFVARTTEGPVLLTVDTCHTRFGWEHAVESGDFTEDQAMHREQLAWLRELAARAPSMQVYLGHQR